ncbi:serine threonine- kinase SBK1-like [Pelobates cultripes]|uniref:Serine threonine- kinase SBK1-like n=1 Tax=Pelobates cultripes TaxID=61616 RepID=A0AAD1S3T6_PELCU|nr:serine threonine- kinase SBK1-like [Pelobates cultripes]
MAELICHDTFTWISSVVKGPQFFEDAVYVKVYASDLSKEPAFQLIAMENKSKNQEIQMIPEQYQVLEKLGEGLLAHDKLAGLVRRDLKPDNTLLMGKECHIKTGDFGLTERFGRFIPSMSHIIQDMAPERSILEPNQ